MFLLLQSELPIRLAEVSYAMYCGFEKSSYAFGFRLRYCLCYECTGGIVDLE